MAREKGPFSYASDKAMFYFILRCSRGIEDELLAKYLENPLNAMIFVEYKQDEPGFDVESESLEEVKRVLHINKTFAKFEFCAARSTCNLLCIGSPGRGKSTLLNELFKLKFEVIEKESAKAFHDSIDVTFASKEVGLDFNVFDFQGIKANHDWHLIKHLLTSLPQAFLLIIGDEEEGEEKTYMSQFAEAFEEEEEDWLEGKFLIINRC